MVQNNPTDVVDTISGSELAVEINQDHNAVITSHKGSSTPSYSTAGLFWIDDTATPWVYKVNDGNGDIEVGEIDPSSDTFEVRFDDSNVSFTATTTQTAIENLDSSTTNINNFNNYLDPDGLTISNNSTDSDHDIDVDGGYLWVNDDSGGTFQSDSSSGDVVQLSDASPAFQLDTTGVNGGVGGRINSSSLSADTWYELGVVADSSGSNNPAVVGYTDANRPTASADLPSGYDLFREMGSPGKTWWVKTDGNSNILPFSHGSGGEIRWTSTAKNTFSTILFTSTAQTSWTSIDISNQSPPATCNVIFSSVLFRDDGSGGFNGEVSVDNDGSVSIESGDANSYHSGSNGRVVVNGLLKAVENQEIFWAISSNDQNFNSLRITKVSSFKAVN